MRFGCHDIRHQRFAHTRPCVRGLVRSVLSLQHEICVLQTTTERCGNLATRLRVGQLCSMIQISPLSGWPRRSKKRRCGTPWQFTSHPGWALARHLLRVTAHPQFLTLELRAPMGAYSGQYCTNSCFSIHDMTSDVAVVSARCIVIVTAEICQNID